MKKSLDIAKKNVKSGFISCMNISFSSMGQKIIVMNQQECIFLRVNTIFYIQADGAYSIIYLSDGRKIIVSKNLKLFSEKLCRELFCRIHKSFIININFIKKYVKNEGGYLIMENGASIPVSINKRNAILNLVENLSL